MTTFFAVAHLAELAPLEVHRLYKLRVDVFVHEQATPYAEIEDLDAAAGTVHVMALQTRRVDGHTTTELVGTARLSPEEVAGEQVIRLGRIIVTPAERGTGLAQELIATALRHVAEKHPDTDVVLSAQEPLTGYYEKFGFRPVGGLTDDTGVPHQPMLLHAAELEGLVSQPV